MVHAYGLSHAPAVPDVLWLDGLPPRGQRTFCHACQRSYDPRVEITLAVFACVGARHHCWMPTRQGAPLWYILGDRLYDEVRRECVQPLDAHKVRIRSTLPECELPVRTDAGARDVTDRFLDSLVATWTPPLADTAPVDLMWQSHEQARDPFPALVAWRRHVKRETQHCLNRYFTQSYCGLELPTYYVLRGSAHGVRPQSRVCGTPCAAPALDPFVLTASTVDRLGSTL